MAKTLIVLVLQLPWLLLVYEAINNSLGPDPGDVVANRLGETALQLLLLVLLLPVLRRFLPVMRFRRLLGLVAFEYVILHVAAYLIFLAGLNLEVIIDDLSERSYIIVGMVALLGLLPMAITSTDKWVKRLKKRWRRVHRLIYLIIPLVLIHVYMVHRLDYQEPIRYALVFLLIIIIKRVRWGSTRR